MTGTLRVLLPHHWVGSLPKRRLPVIVSAEVCRAESCADCAHRAVDDRRNLYKEDELFRATLTDVVYCSLHGWGFPAVEDEQKYYCLDYAARPAKEAAPDLLPILDDDLDPDLLIDLVRGT